MLVTRALSRGVNLSTRKKKQTFYTNNLIPFLPIPTVDFRIDEASLPASHDQIRGFVSSLYCWNLRMNT